MKSHTDPTAVHKIDRSEPDFTLCGLRIKEGVQVNRVVHLGTTCSGCAFEWAELVKAPCSLCEAEPGPLLSALIKAGHAVLDREKGIVILADEDESAAISAATYDDFADIEIMLEG